MKKGCFLTVIFVGTLIIGLIIYIVKSEPSVLKNFAKEKITEYAYKEFDSKFNNLKYSVYNDSLKQYFHQKVDSLMHSKRSFKDAMQDLEHFIKRADVYFDRGLIDSIDYQNFKEYIRDYERPKKN
ncbi:MAG: hypothetical protein KF816_09405 [Melioribacteraceae bacterium]|jgi:hypothetical protein|nr:hypothetical protein [Melioribacteraceae bacterium]